MMSAVTEIARTIAGRSPITIRGTKEMLLHSRDHSVEDGLKYIAAWNAGMLSKIDLGAGLMAPRGEDPEYQD